MSAENGIATVRAFTAAFNRMDRAAIADTFNFPHVRLNKGVFTIFQDREDYFRKSAGLKARLEAEGWHHTTLESVDIINETPDKVHMNLKFTRRRADDSIYNPFETLWIATLVNGHWGIAFRSSYLGE